MWRESVQRGKKMELATGASGQARVCSAARDCGRYPLTTFKVFDRAHMPSFQVASLITSNFSRAEPMRSSSATSRDVISTHNESN
jgi:hypothetical protein